jgi:hypothetical protein
MVGAACWNAAARVPFDGVWEVAAGDALQKRQLVCAPALCLWASSVSLYLRGLVYVVGPSV